MLNYHVYTEVEYLWHSYVILLVFQKSCLFKMTVQLFKAFILNSLSKVLRLEGQDETVTQQLRWLKKQCTTFGAFCVTT